jgi:AAA family ATP:ADP antiporter
MISLVFVVLSPDPYALVLGWMPPVAIALIVGRGLAYGIAEPARHSLFVQVPRSERYKGQNAVDTAVWRFGDLTIALGMDALRAVGVAAPGFAALGALSAAAAGLVGWRVPQGGVEPSLRLASRRRWRRTRARLHAPKEMAGRSPPLELP